MNPPHLMPALLTPFDREGDLDVEAHLSNVGLLADAGVSGFLIAGSTGGGPYLEPGERSNLVSAARRAAPHSMLLCGINAETERGAVTQIAEASDAGADAVLVITPTTLIRGRDRLVEAFYRDVADDSDVPVFLYTVPSVTGYDLPVGVISRLAAHPNVAGIKDSGGDPGRVTELASAIEEGLIVYVGASRAVAASVEAGAHGAITASANYCWDLVADVIRAAHCGDDACGSLQATLDGLVATVEPMGVAGTMAAAGLVGLSPGWPRSPLREIEPGTRSLIAAALDSAGLARVDD